MRRAAAQALRGEGPANTADLRALAALLGDSDEAVRAAAVQALGRIGSAAVPALTEALDDPSKHIRRQALCALERLGRAACPAIPALAHCLQDPEVRVRAGAVLALGAIGPEAAGAVPSLINALTDGNRFFTRLVQWAICRIGTAALNSLAAALGEVDPDLRRRAAQALEEIRREERAQEATRVVPQLPLESRRLLPTTPLLAGL
jgi:HEAT repeat protein